MTDELLEWVKFAHWVEKGDVPGHPFHGNQWIDGVPYGGNTGRSEATARAMHIADIAHTTTDPNRNGIAALHRAAASLHAERAESLSKAAAIARSEGHEGDAREMEQAAKAHVDAATAHQSAADLAREAGLYWATPNDTKASIGASDKALAASENADAITRANGLDLETPL